MKHIVSFYSHGKPKLVIRNGRTTETDELELSGNIGFELSFNRYCIGYKRFSKDHLCPQEALSDSGQCPHCRKRELSCAACRGDECLFGKKECMLGEHYIYLASFGELVKAGVTKKERIMDRWIEQGADFGVIIAKAKDGFEARAVEALVQHQFGFRNAVRTSEKLRLLGRNGKSSRDSIEAALEKTKASGFPGIDAGEVTDLSANYPALSEKPVLDSSLSGLVLGAKGYLLFLDREGLKVVDMKKVVGRYLTR